MSREQAAAFIGYGTDICQICRGKGDGLLGDHVLACTERLDRQGLMPLVGGGDGDEIHLGVGEDLLKGCIRVNAVLLGKICALLLDIINAKQLNGTCFQNMAGVPSAHAAVADDNASLFHNRSSFRSKKGKNALLEFIIGQIVFLFKSEMAKNKTKNAAFDERYRIFSRKTQKS